MDPITIGLIAMGVGAGVKAIGGAMDNTGDTLRQEAGLKLSDLEETQRRAEGQQTQVLSSTKARMAGTGFATDSKSFTGYLGSMATEFQRQNDFQKKQGMAQIDLMNQAGSQADVNKWLGVTSGLLGSAGSILGGMKAGR